MRTRRAAYALEFALLLPVWVTALLGMFDLSWLAVRSATLAHAMSDACAEGARLDPGVGDANLTAMESAVESAFDTRLSAFGQGSCAACTVTAVISGTAPQRHLVCTVVAPTEALIGTFVTAPTLTRVRVAPLAWSWPAP